MEKKFTIITFFIGAISSLSYLVFIFLRNYNSPENIEERCTAKFQKDIKKGIGKSDKEWGLNMDMANDNYFKCMNIPWKQLLILLIIRDFPKQLINAFSLVRKKSLSLLHEDRKYKDNTIKKKFFHNQKLLYKVNL